jgi:phage tail-like protein
MPASRTYVSGSFHLTVDGVKTGFLKSVEGGAPTAEVVSEAADRSSPFIKKHLGALTYEPLVLRFGLSMDKSLYEWINASWQHNYMRKNGAVVTTDADLEAVSQREFFHALITEVTIPALDGSSKDPGFLTVTLAPEYTRVSKASGKPASSTTKQKKWLPSNFKVAIDGLDCTRITAVESFTVKQSVVRDEIGDHRDYEKEPGLLEFPNLSFTLGQRSAKSWNEWFDSFVVKGNNGDDQEKNGSISLMSADGTSELLRIDLFNLGIFRMGPDKIEANSDKVATVTARLYCERMELTLGEKAAAPQAQVKRQMAKVKGKVKRSR